MSGNINKDLEQQLAELNKNIKEIKAEYKVEQKKEKELNAQLKTIEEQLKKEMSRNDMLVEKRDNLKEKYNSLQHSKIWRSTAPIRKFVALFKIISFSRNKGILKYVKAKITNKEKRQRLRNKEKKEMDKIKGRLYNLGFTERPLLELEAIYGDKSKPDMSKHAAFELARWYANQHNAWGAQRSLEILPAAKEGETNPIRLRHIAIIEAECQEALGNKEAGREVIYNAINSLGEESNLYFAAANFETNSEGRISWINRALQLHNTSPISYNPAFTELSMAGLKPGKEMNKKDQVSANYPLVTIIVPAYNAEPNISNAIESILVQTWSNLEVLVVDDCSNDNTVAVVERYANKDTRVKLIKAEENMGPYVARNLALKNARGEFITTHDTDDWSHPEKIETQVRHLLDNPSVMGNTSQMVRTHPNLKFYRGNNPGNLVFKFISSFMFRRSPVMDKIGFWDCVRFGADNEFIRRIRKVFGENAVIDLSTGPLSFYRKSEDTLTGGNAFGHPGFYMGARKEYFEAQTYYHEKATNLNYNFPQQSRPFPVPEPMWPRREVKEGGQRYFDVIIVSDFRMYGGSVNSCVEEIKAQKKMGLRTGLLQMCWYNIEPQREILPNVRDLVDGEEVQIIVYGEKVSCGLLILRYPPILQEKQRFLPDVEANEVKVIVNQPPMSDYGPNGVFRYEIERCQQNIQEYFNQPGIWHPIGPRVREALHQHHSGELKYIHLSEDDWTNIIDVNEWKRNSKLKCNNKIRIGRHSRDHKVKWPEDPRKLLMVYPDSENYEIHVLGGAKIPEKILGYLPSNWYVKEFGELHPREFLHKLDVWVYFTNDDWVESFGRVIIEALAVGVPVILPPYYQDLFKEAAIYAEPSDVKEKIDGLMDDNYYYERQVEKALQFVETHFGYTSHAERLGAILGKTYKSNEQSKYLECQ